MQVVPIVIVFQGEVIEEPPTKAPTHSPANSLSTGDYVGIVIGCVVGAAAVITCLYFAIMAARRSNDREGSSKITPTNMQNVMFSDVEAPHYEPQHRQGTMQSPRDVLVERQGTEIAL